MNKIVSRLDTRRFKVSDYGVVIGFAVLCIAVGIAAPAFFGARNILNLLRQSSIVGIIAVGMTSIIISGNFDISVGAIAAISGAVTMKLLSAAVPLPLAILGAILAGLVIGVGNGLAVAKLGIPSLIATMGMTTILNGVVLLVTGGYPISGLHDTFDYIGNGYLLGVPIPVVIFALSVLVMFFILRGTKFGRYIFSVGGNEESSRLSGIKPDQIKIQVFAMSGMLSALAGIVLTSRLGTATPVAGAGYDMDAIASVVIGGTSVLGGEGSVLKTVIGVLFMSVINNAFNLLGVDVYFQYIIKGLIIIVAVGADSYSRKKAMRV
ncbi:ribose ABC transporter permease [Oscillospiraceae bacterium PP1C4]